MEKVHVNLRPRSYDIQIGSGNLASVAQFCDPEHEDSHAVIITDSNVDELYSEPVGDALQEAGAQVDVLVTDAGEASKSADVAAVLWRLHSGAGCGSCKCRRLSWRRSTARSAARWASICRAARTWSVRSGSR